MSAVLLTGGQQSQVIPSQTGTVCQFVCLSVRLSVCLSVCHYVCPFNICNSFNSC